MQGLHAVRRLWEQMAQESLPPVPASSGVVAVRARDSPRSSVRMRMAS